MMEWRPSGYKLSTTDLVHAIFDSKSDSVGPFISAVDAFKVWTSKEFLKEIL